MPLNNKKDLSLAYTPGVAEPCLEIAKNRKLAYSYTIKGNSVAVVSDGSAVLGLGNIGAHAAIPVMEGKAAIFKRFANIDAFPICLETQDTEKIIDIVRNISPVFGGINLEDISAPRCFEIEKRLINELEIPVMHDDQHGTAVVALAGLINALKVTGKRESEIKVIVNGAGAAGIAVTKMLLNYGAKNIILSDTSGAIYKGRKENMNSAKEEIATATNKNRISGPLAEILKGADVFIGVSGPSILKREHIASMNSPIVFAMANPTPEIMPDEAKKGGAAIVATGRSDFPNQVNNSLGFPGIFRGAFDADAKRINEEMKLAAAEALAAIVEEPAADCIIPDSFNPNVVPRVSKAVAEAARKTGVIRK